MHKVQAMAKARVPITVRVDAALAERMRKFVYNNCGAPLHCRSLGTLVAQSVTREMDRLELVLAGALPLDRAAGRDADGGTAVSPSRRRPMNTTH